MSSFKSSKLAFPWIVPIMLAAAIAVSISSCTTANEDKVAELQSVIAGYEEKEDQVTRNLAVMRKADEAWNARDWKTFEALHSQDVVVPSPHNPEGSVGIEAHSEEMQAFIRAFPDHHIELPYKVTFGQSDWIVAAHENGGTFTNDWVFPNGYVIKPTGKKFTMIMATIGKVKDGQLEHELLIFDQGSMFSQLGIDQ